MQGVELQLKHVHAVGVYGWGSVFETIIGEWLVEISRNQVSVTSDILLIGNSYDSFLLSKCFMVFIYLSHACRCIKSCKAFLPSGPWLLLVLVLQSLFPCLLRATGRIIK